MIIKRGQKVINSCLVIVIGFLMAFVVYSVTLKSLEARKDYVALDKHSSGYVLFYKDDCPDCQKVYPMIVRSKLAGKSIKLVNLNNGKNTKYIKKYHLKTVPTFVKMKSGRVFESYAGVNLGTIKIFMIGEKNEKVR